MRRKNLLISILTTSVLSLLLLPTLDLDEPVRKSQPRAPSRKTSHIVQGAGVDTVTAAVQAVGGQISHSLGIIHAVAAELTAEQRDQLATNPAVWRIHDNPPVKAAVAVGSLTDTPTAAFSRLVGADVLQQQGITGAGVTLAVLDTGYSPHEALRFGAAEQPRVLAHYDAIADEELPVTVKSDENGHGTHVASISVSSERLYPGDAFGGIAPDAGLVVVKALGASGQATYADAIRGLDWIVAHRAIYGIRVLNLALSAPLRSHYWDDPLNQAVMRAWAAGIAVVAAAGNQGPAPMTIGVPGNLPYIITVGAMTDNYTPEDPSDDLLASFSAAGPTAEGFVKPDVVAPGGHLRGLMHPSTTTAREHREFRDGQHFIMSGTSQATAVVSGVALLLLAADPSLSPDDLKCRLLATARPAVDGAGRLAYNPLQQGAGLINAPAAVNSSAQGCANRGLAVRQDIHGSQHFAGPVRLDSDHWFYLHGVGYTWTATYDRLGYSFTGGDAWSDPQTWSEGNPWAAADVWINGDPWIDAQGDPWIDAQGDPWIDVEAWWNRRAFWSHGLSETMAINRWVEQE